MITTRVGQKAKPNPLWPSQNTPSIRLLRQRSQEWFSSLYRRGWWRSHGFWAFLLDGMYWWLVCMMRLLLLLLRLWLWWLWWLLTLTLNLNHVLPMLSLIFLLSLKLSNLISEHVNLLSSHDFSCLDGRQVHHQSVAGSTCHGTFPDRFIRSSEIQPLSKLCSNFVNLINVLIGIGNHARLLDQTQKLFNGITIRFALMAFQIKSNTRFIEFMLYVLSSPFGGRAGCYWWCWGCW